MYFFLSFQAFQKQRFNPNRPLEQWGINGFVDNL